MKEWITTVEPASLHRYQQQQLQFQVFHSSQKLTLLLPKPNTFTSNPPNQLSRCNSQPSSPSSSPPLSQHPLPSPSAKQVPTTPAVPSTTWCLRAHIKPVTSLVILVCQFFTLSSSHGNSNQIFSQWCCSCPQDCSWRSGWTDGNYHRPYKGD